MVLGLRHCLRVVLERVHARGRRREAVGRVTRRALRRRRPAHDVLRDGGAVRARPRLGRVGEGEAGGVDDAVRPYEGDGDLRGLPHPLPAALELRDVGDDAEHGLLAAVHRLGLHVAEPHLQVRREVVARQLEHRHVPAAVQLQ